MSQKKPDDILPEHKRVVEQRLADYLAGKSKPISHEELMRRVHIA